MGGPPRFRRRESLIRRLTALAHGPTSYPLLGFVRRRKIPIANNYTFLVWLSLRA
jgi:hypothetical protein